MQASHHRGALAATSLGALGVVYGDIGTSPLYAIKECLGATSPHAVAPDRIAVMGVLSLMFWALVLVVVLKYLVFVLRADNKGEGGILALVALVEGDESRRTRLAVPLLLALFGAGLLFGDGVITPAISVIGAMEGLSEQSPQLTQFVVPVSVAILIALFFVQRHGTGRIGVVFGPIMLVWFIVIGIAGARWIVTAPEVLAAINPIHAVRFFQHEHLRGFLLLGSVILAVTGGEALYADMGHFGRTPIRLAWFTIAMPGILLSYFGQGALLLTRGAVANPFFALVEGPLLIPMIILATMAAIIASQALISGVFSLTRQAMQLGFWPRMTVVHTSADAEGQIYVPEMNWFLMVACVALVLEFRTTTALASAYGIAVAGTMAITSILFYLLAVRRWHWRQAHALPHLIFFLTIDLAFLGACGAKFLHGGWFPIAVGVGVFGIMTTWWRGRLELARIMDAGAVPTDLFLADLELNPLPRVDGTAVFMSSSAEGVPNVVLHHVKHNRVLHRQVVLFSLRTEAVPWVGEERQVEVKELGQGIWRVIGCTGFVQSPDVPALLARCAPFGIDTTPMHTTYYLGRQTLLTTGRAPVARWRKLLFGFLSHNARAPTAFFNLPPNRVVELGLQIEL